MNDDAGVAEALKPVWAQTPRSPLAGAAAMLAARSYQRAGQPQLAADILRRYSADTPQPEAALALAAAYEAVGNKQNAAGAFQTVYYSYPASKGMEQAEAALERLRADLGVNFPPVSTQTLLSRAVKLMEAGQHRQARHELEALLPSLRGPDRDFAQLRIGYSYYRAREYANAITWLSTVQTAGAEADAERLFYLLQSHRRLNHDAEAQRLLEQMRLQHTKSRWRLDALIAMADPLAAKNQFAQAEPLYRTCATDFGGDPKAAHCHWRLAFNQYMRRDPQAGGMLREHLRSYPASDHAASAMYFLGRLAENASDPASARAWYDEIDRSYPNYYYAVQARQRLREPSVAAAQPAAGVVSFLRSVNFPAHPRRVDFTPTLAAQRRMERSRLLTAAGLDDFAENELRYGARTDGQPEALALALADLSMKRQSPERSIRYLKRYVPGYLALPFEGASKEFWRLTFPVPYRDLLEQFSKSQELDPFLVAALIRQESEFDTKVVSHARAYGLTQVLPSTGRELARRLGIQRFSAAMLFKPDVNLQLGTYYFRSLLNRLDGSVEAALAAYNAGINRVTLWQKWADYREPAEFIETIPFDETRGYVQSVIRNADTYRRIYGGKTK